MVKWTHLDSGPASAAPMIMDGTVYIGFGDNIEAIGESQTEAALALHHRTAPSPRPGGSPRTPLAASAAARRLRRRHTACDQQLNRPVVWSLTRARRSPGSPPPRSSSSPPRPATSSGAYTPACNSGTPSPRPQPESRPVIVDGAVYIGGGHCHLTISPKPYRAEPGSGPFGCELEHQIGKYQPRLAPPQYVGAVEPYPGEVGMAGRLLRRLAP